MDNRWRNCCRTFTGSRRTIIAMALVIALTLTFLTFSSIDDSEAATTDTFVVDDCVYKVTSKKNVELKSYEGSNEIVQIPDKVAYGSKTYTVHSIGSGAFENSVSLVELTIPGKVFKLGAHTFKDCKNLRKLTIPIELDPVSSKKKPAFEGCDGITDYVFTKGYYNESVSYLYGGLHKKTPWHFGKEGLEINITIEKGVKTIGFNMFMDCPTKILTFKCADSVKKINSSIAGTTIKEMTVPMAASMLGSNLHIVYGVLGLEKLTLTKGDGDPYDYSYLTTYKNKVAPWATSASTFKTLIVEEGVTEIGKYYFLNCTQLETVQLPSTLKTLKKCAFENCTSLKKVIIPDSVTKIGESAFKNCTNLRDITLPININTVVNDDDPAFRGCENIENVTITKGSGYGHDYARNPSTPWHYSADSIKRITIGEGVKKIGSYTFQNCKSLESLQLPNTLKTVNKYAFENCSNLKEIVIPNDVTKLGKAAFKNCTGLTQLTVPISLNTVVKNDDPAFEGCMGIGKVTLTAGTGHGHKYGDNTYTPWHISKDSFKTLVVEKGVKSIGKNTFKGCMNIQEMSFGSDLTSIGKNAFKGFTFRNADGITIPISAENLRGCTFRGTSDNMVMV